MIGEIRYAVITIRSMRVKVRKVKVLEDVTDQVDPDFHLIPGEREYDCAVQRDDGSFGTRASYILPASDLYLTREAALNAAAAQLARDRDTDIEYINRRFTEALRELLNNADTTDGQSD